MPRIVRYDDNNFPIYDPNEDISPQQAFEREAQDRGIAHYRDPTSGQNTWDLAYGGQERFGAGAQPKLYNWGGGEIPDSLRALLDKYQMASPEDMKYMQTPDPKGGSDLSNIMKLFGAVVGGGMGLESMLGGAGALEGTAGDWWSGMPSGSSEWSGGLSGADGGMTGNVVEANMPTSVGGDVADNLDYGADTPYRGDPYSTGTDPNMGPPPGSPGAPGGGYNPGGESVSGSYPVSPTELKAAADAYNSTGILPQWMTKLGITPGNLLTTGAQLLGAGINYFGATQAAKAQQQGAQSQQDLLRYMYDQNRADLAPWRKAGEGALSNLVNLTTPGKQLDTAMLDPGYAFRQSEGEKGINRAAAARGLWDSGGTYKALDKFNQNFATGEFGNVYNRNANLAGLGQVAVGQGVNAGQNYANQAGESMLQAANARASGYVGGANAISGGLSGMLRNYNEQALLDKLLSGRTG